MSSVDERLGTLEANAKALFHQVDELKEEVRDIRRLTIAIEKIAGKVDNIDLQAYINENNLPIHIVVYRQGAPIPTFKE